MECPRTEETRISRMFLQKKRNERRKKYLLCALQENPGRSCCLLWNASINHKHTYRYYLIAHTSTIRPILLLPPNHAVAAVSVLPLLPLCWLLYCFLNSVNTSPHYPFIRHRTNRSDVCVHACVCGCVNVVVG